MRKSKWLLFAGMLSAVIALTACGSDEDDSASGTTPGGQDGQPPTEQDSGNNEEELTLEDEYGSGIENPQSELESVTEEAHVTSVIDANTVEIENEDGETETVRLLLVDTPKPDEPEKSGHEYGQLADEFTANRLTDAPILLERGDPATDDEGNTLAHVWMRNGPDYFNFGKFLVTEGHARVIESDQNTKYLDEFREEEEKAKAEGQEELGDNIWSVPGYVTDSGFDTSVLQ